MLNSIAVKNYQSLVDLSLELGMFTVVVGETDSGKSAFVRAVKSLVENTTGNKFITFGKKYSSVELLSAEGKLIWKKQKTTASYDLNGVVMGKLGGAVPEDVAKFLRMGEVDVGDSVSFNLNFACQFDSPFLVMDSGSYVAKVLGELSNVNLPSNACK